MAIDSYTVIRVECLHIQRKHSVLYNTLPYISKEQYNNVIRCLVVFHVIHSALITFKKRAHRFVLACVYMYR